MFSKMSINTTTKKQKKASFLHSYHQTLLSSSQVWCLSYQAIRYARCLNFLTWLCRSVKILNWLKIILKIIIYSVLVARPQCQMASAVPVIVSSTEVHRSMLWEITQKHWLNCSRMMRESREVKLKLIYCTFSASLWGKVLCGWKVGQRRWNTYLLRAYFLDCELCHLGQVCTVPCLTAARWLLCICALHESTMETYGYTVYLSKLVWFFQALWNCFLHSAEDHERH